MKELHFAHSGDWCAIGVRCYVLVIERNDELSVIGTEIQCHVRARSSRYVFHMLLGSPAPSYFAVEDHNVLPRLACTGIATPVLAIVSSEYNCAV